MPVQKSRKSLVQINNPVSPAQRIDWSNKDLKLPDLDLVQVQKDSYAWFLTEGIKEVLEEISPIEDFTGKNWQLTLINHKFQPPKQTAEMAREKEITLDQPLKVTATLTNKQTGQSQTQEVFLGDIPVMTERGTFIINGIERVVVNQLVRSPGVFYSAEVDLITGRMLYTAELRPLRGSWLEFSLSRNDILTVKIDRRRKFPATTFLRAMGLGTEDQLLAAFSGKSEQVKKCLAATLEKDQGKSQDEALLEIYRKMRPGDPLILENAKNLMESMFFNHRRYNLGKVGRYKLNKKLGLETPNTQDNWTLKTNDVIETISYLCDLQNGLGKVDDTDHLANRRVRRVGELVTTNVFRVGLLRLERVIRERMSLAGADIEITPTTLINARPIIAAINEFFRSSQLSSILDQTNPLSEIDNLRRLSVMGTGGVTRERASFSIRDINHSQYGRICPIRSPEGPNIGLVTYMALYARVNEYGFLETPYRRIVLEKGKPRITDEIVYLSADEEEKYYITHAEVTIDNKGYIQDQRVPLRKEGDFFIGNADQANFIDVVPRQIVGTSASLIPFLSHDDTPRALMGTHMQCQAVPLLLAAAPTVGTGMEKLVAQSMGRTIFAEDDGVVDYVDGQKLIVSYGKGAKIDKKIYPIAKFVRSAQSTCFSQYARVKVGQKIQKGDLLIDGPAADGGELALGQNLTIAYMSFEGLGYEDGIVISDRLVKEDILTSINIEEHEAAVVDTKLGPEETTRDIPNVSEEDLRNLDQNGIVMIGAEVGPEDILVGKIAPKGETELTVEERLLRAIFGEKAREVRDTSLRMPHGERGTVIDIKILDREKGDELEPGTKKLIKVKVAQMRKVVVGDKLAGRHGNKGIIAKIVPVYDMPYLADGTIVDIIMSPLAILQRMNLGQLLEAHLGWAATKSGYKAGVPVFEELPPEIIEKELKKAGLPEEGKSILYDGKTGKPFDNPVVVGTAYIMKLIHMVEDKTHARSTGPYSLVTQQPLGGKAQMGGQRLGEMEVWALEAYGAAHILQEMLTIKSDDVVGRAKAFEAIVKGIDIPQAMVPESFKVLVKELNSLSLDVQMIQAIMQKEEIATEKQVQEEEKIAGEVKEMEEVLEMTSGEELDNVTKEESPLEVEEVQIENLSEKGSKK